ncbi:MAG: SIS domain-containing protein [Alphaproteobacteria bacterium]
MPLPMTRLAPAPAAHRHLDAARSVLQAEIVGIEALVAALENGLGAPFDAAVACLAAVSGRVIVSGIGKSGHVGTKLAATLASTGKPAQFVHAAEASHGDLGMITAEDAVIALSKSGETAELRDLVAFTRRFEIPLVAMTFDADSALARQARIALVLPDMPEACPNGLAPTTSTTMMMALGDALAVALLRQSGFTAVDFKRFHPGGKLGAQLMAVRDVMHRADAVPLVGAQTKMSEALMTMSAKRLGCVGVTDEAGALIGIITDGDLRRNLTQPDLLERPAESLMTRQPKTISPTVLAAEAVNIMNTNEITCLFIVEDGKPLGVIHLHDMLRVGVA